MKWRKIAGFFRPGSDERSYRRQWDFFTDEKRARELIYNVADQAAFEEGGRADAEMLAASSARGRRPRHRVRAREDREVPRAPLPRDARHGHLPEDDRRRAAAPRGIANVHLHVGNGRNLSPLPDGRFDVVFSFYVLQHVEREDAFRYLREIARVLRPGDARSSSSHRSRHYFHGGFLSDLAKATPTTLPGRALHSVGGPLLAGEAGLAFDGIHLRHHDTVYRFRAPPRTRSRSGRGWRWSIRSRRWGYTRSPSLGPPAAAPLLDLAGLAGAATMRAGVRGRCMLRGKGSP